MILTDEDARYWSRSEQQQMYFIANLWLSEAKGM